MLLLYYRYTILKHIRDAVKEKNSVKSTDILNYFKGKSLNTAEGYNIKVTNARYFTKSFFISYNPNGDEYTRKPMYSYPSAIYSNGFDLSESDNYTQVCDFYNENKDSSIITQPIHIGFLFTSLMSEKVKIVNIIVRWYLNFLRSEKYFDSRLIVYIFVLYINRYHINMNVQQMMNLLRN